MKANESNQVGFIVVTTDKCYENRETMHPYRESDPMGGHDPYSSSKGAAELVISAYRRSYPDAPLIASVRAGNVIGGGDWALDRLVPDIVRAMLRGEPVKVRNPASNRPWQHVLEALSGYLLIAERLLEGDGRIATAFNFGPANDDTQPVRWVVDQGRYGIDFLRCRRQLKTSVDQCHHRDHPARLRLVLVVAAAVAVVHELPEARVVGVRRAQLAGARGLALAADLDLHVGVGAEVEEPAGVVVGAADGGHDDVVRAVARIDEAVRANGA